jgi:threonine synthase
MATFFVMDSNGSMMTILPALTKKLVDFGSCAILKTMIFQESLLTHLECPECSAHFDADKVQTFCAECKSPLLARYDFERARTQTARELFAARPRGLWRWAELLPVRAPAHRLTLGEGDTPLLKSAHLGMTYGFKNLYIKDESTNPAGSIKARGLATVVSRAMELGVHAFVISTGGNSGGALAAYVARGRAQAHVYMPKDAPLASQVEVQRHGADLHLVDGPIADVAKLAGEEAAKRGWFDLSTFKEPYRCEGIKTMGFELAESFGWELPEVIIYPTGGGTGLVGMWKAFAELESLGWIGAQRPRMVSVQAAGCAPIVRAVQENKDRVQFWDGAQTIASGLRAPGAFADRLILRAIRESHGTALAVTDDEILVCQKEMATTEGILAAPEGAATLAALKKLRATGWLAPDERIVLINTGAGLKYL